MAGFAAADGGRSLKAGLLAFGTLIWAAPALAQSSRSARAACRPARRRTSLARRTPAQPSASSAAAPTSAADRHASRAAGPASSTVAVPKDWRGVFDAIDAGNWASAQAGIAALPPGLLTPVAKAELYTAKGSPAVDLASLQALIAEAPELPQADQLAPMAVRRGATTAPLIDPGEGDRQPRLGAGPLSRPSRLQGEPAADQLRALLDPLIKADDAAGAEAQLLIYAPQLSVEARAEAGTARRLRLLCPRPRHRCAPRRRHLAPGRDRRMGVAGGLDLRPRLVAPGRLRMPHRALSSRSQPRPAARASRRRLYWAARAEQACRPARGRSNRLLKRRREHGEARKASTACSPAKRWAWTPNCRPIRSPAAIRRSTNCPMSSARSSSPGSASPRSPRKCFATRPRSALPAEHHALIQLAKTPRPARRRSCGSPTTASRAPGPTPPTAIPTRAGAPLNGWRVDPALAFGHIVQESAFRRTAVSGAGAVGLMQVLPITAQHDLAQPRRALHARGTDRSATTTSNMARASSR